MHRGSGGIIPDAVANNLQTRDISEQDYETLLQLDRYIFIHRQISFVVITNLET